MIRNSRIIEGQNTTLENNSNRLIGRNIKGIDFVAIGNVYYVAIKYATFSSSTIRNHFLLPKIHLDASDEAEALLGVSSEDLKILFIKFLIYYCYIYSQLYFAVITEHDTNSHYNQ
jgi:hypothetical protein